MKNQNVYKANLKALKSRFPLLYTALIDRIHPFPFPNNFFLTKNNEVNVAVVMPDGRNISFYEEEDIFRQTRKILSAHELHKHDIIMCIGMGLGYLPLTAVQTYAEKPKIVVVERYAEVFDLAMRAVDLRRLFSYENLDLFVGGEFSVPDMVSYYGDILYAGTCRRVVHMASRQIFGQNFLMLEKEIDENIDTLLLNWNTIRLHGQKVMHNAMKNLSSLFESVQIGALRDRFKGMPAICVASGPSLSKDLPAIKYLAGKALILACDSAVKPLVAEGITPHMVFVVDHDKEDFEKIRTEVGKIEQSILVFFVEANVDSVRGFLGEKRIFVSAGTSIIEHWLGPDLKLNCRLDGTVSSNGDSAVLTAIALGADPIVLVGMDLAFSDGKDHADGCAFRCEQMDDLLTLTSGVKGFPVYSLPAMITGKVLLEKMISASRRRFIDSSLNGALIKGTEIRSLTELAQTEIFGSNDIRQVLDAIFWQSTLQRSDIESSFKRMALITEELKKAAYEGLITIKNKYYTNATDRHYTLQYSVDRGLAHYKKMIHRFDETLNLINCMRYEKQLETDRKIISLGRDNNLSKEKINKNTLAILKDFFSSVYRSSRLFELLLTRQKAYFEKISALKMRIENYPDDFDKRLELARIHAGEGIVWMAVREYRKYIKKVPDDLSAWIELIQCYMDIRLWKEANETHQQALNRFSERQRLVQLGNELTDGLRVLMTTARQEMINSEKGDQFGKLRARHAIMNYLYAMPDDQEAKIIEIQIQELDNLEDRRIQEKACFIYSPVQLQDLKDKARWFVESGKAEQAVGIYEGLSSRYPEDASLYREKIGDIRFGQNDLPGALWNYQQGLQTSPEEESLNIRVRWVKPLVDARKLQNRKSVLAASIIVPVTKNPEKASHFIDQIRAYTSAPHEIILTIDARDSELLNNISLTVAKRRNIHLVTTEAAPHSSKSINLAIFRSVGNHIVLLSPEFTPCPKWFESLVDHLAAQPHAGLIQPIVRSPEEYTRQGMNLLFSNKEQTLRHRRVLMTTSCTCLCVLFRRDVLNRIGLMDEAFTHSAMMLEDYRARCAMEGFRNIIAADMHVPGTVDCLNEEDRSLFEIKWNSTNLPYCLEEKKNYLMLLQRSQEFINKGDVDKAVSLFIDAIATYPESDWIYCSIAQLLIVENRYGEAIEALNAMPGVNDGTVTRHGHFEIYPHEKSLLWAMALAGMGKSEDAQAYIDQSVKTNPNLPVASVLRGRLSLKQNDVKTAEACFRKAILDDPGFGPAYSDLSGLYSSAGDEKTAFELLRKAFALSPDDPNIMSAYHFAVIERGCHEEAEKLFNESVEIFSDNKRLHYLRIDLILLQKKFGPAMDRIDEAINRFGVNDGILDAAEQIRKLADLPSPL